MSPDKDCRSIVVQEDGEKRMIPRRFMVFAKYVEYKLKGKKTAPNLMEMVRFLVQPSELSRGSRFIKRVEPEGDWIKVWLTNGYTLPIYYHTAMSWTSFCATVDETLNPNNWHYYQTRETPISSNDIVVDCGCAEGLFTFVTAPKAKRVIAFEPLPRYQDMLQQTFAGVHNVVIRTQALGNQEGILNFTDQELESHASVDGTIEVAVTTLDKALEDLEDRVTYIKADIEGAEMSMLEGAKNMIKKHRPKIALTVYHSGNDVQDIHSFLAGLHADYQFRTKGIVANGNPVMLHVW